MINEAKVEADQIPADALIVTADVTDPAGWDSQRERLLATMEREGLRALVAVRVRPTIEIIERVLFERAEAAG
jgi:hypothetical protein